MDSLDLAADQLLRESRMSAVLPTEAKKPTSIMSPSKGRISSSPGKKVRLSGFADFLNSDGTRSRSRVSGKLRAPQRKSEAMVESENVADPSTETATPTKSRRTTRQSIFEFPVSPEKPLNAPRQTRSSQAPQKSQLRSRNGSTQDEPVAPEVIPVPQAVGSPKRPHRNLKSRSEAPAKKQKAGSTKDSANQQDEPPLRGDLQPENKRSLPSKSGAAQSQPARGKGRLKKSAAPPPTTEMHDETVATRTRTQGKGTAAAKSRGTAVKSSATTTTDPGKNTKRTKKASIPQPHLPQMSELVERPKIPQTSEDVEMNETSDEHEEDGNDDFLSGIFFGQLDHFKNAFKGIDDIGVDKLSGITRNYKPETDAAASIGELCRAIIKTYEAFLTLSHDEIQPFMDTLDEQLHDLEELTKQLDPATEPKKSANALLIDIYTAIIPDMVQVLQAAFNYFGASAAAESRGLSITGVGELCNIAKLIVNVYEPAYVWGRGKLDGMYIVKPVQNKIITPIKKIIQAFRRQYDKMMREESVHKLALRQMQRQKNEEGDRLRQEEAHRRFLERKLRRDELYLARRDAEKSLTDVRIRHLAQPEDWPTTVRSLVEVDANGEPYERVELFKPREDFSSQYWAQAFERVEDEPWSDEQEHTLIIGLERFSGMTTLFYGTIMSNSLQVQILTGIYLNITVDTTQAQDSTGHYDLSMCDRFYIKQHISGTAH